MSRLEQLLKFVEEDPRDPFNVYAVALEYVKLDSEKASVYFEDLLTSHPRYVATYYTYGKLMELENKLERAKEIFEKGIKLAEEVQDQKAQRELRNALSELEFNMNEL